MAERIGFRTIWRSAGVPGVVLAAVSIAYMLANFHLTKTMTVWGTALVTVLDLAKIIACIWLMKTFLVQFKRDNEEATRGDLRRLGKWIAILSALIFSAAMMAFFQIHTEVVSEVINRMMTTYGDMMDTNAVNALQEMENNYPRILFVSNFIYCSVFGWVLSAILSARIIPDNPFSDIRNEENE